MLLLITIYSCFFYMWSDYISLEWCLCVLTFDSFTLLIFLECIELESDEFYEYLCLSSLPFFTILSSMERFFKISYYCRSSFIISFLEEVYFLLG